MSTLFEKLVAEGLGTFLLSLVVLLMLSNGAVTGIHPLFFIMSTLAMLVYMFGSVSGAHFNPAITVGIICVKKISIQRGIQYMFAQMCGAMCAWALLQFTPAHNYSLVAGQALGPNLGMDFASEFLGTAFLAFAVSSVAFGRVPQALSGLVVALGLFVGAGVASSLFLSGSAILNPAVGLAVDGFIFPYIAGQLFGGVVGVYAGKLFFSASR
jgi:glycerol uptake facilitator-like aquaporin